MKDRDDQVSINIFDLIDSICADFRKQWKAGKRPKIEEYLLKVAEEARANLFKNLLLVDIRYRTRAGERPSANDYLKRFGEYRRLVGDAFHQSTSMSMEELHSTPRDSSDEMAVTVAAPGANQLGDYELIRELGRGGFGVVYEAKHLRRGNRVALKTLPTGHDGQEINAERLHKFRREFRSLSEVNHPNLVGMQTLEVDSTQWFFTMDLIAGEDFLGYVRPGGKLDESRLRESLKQLVAGVLALHDQRILHRDLKPSNVLVGSDGRVSILDFGLVAELEQRTDQTASLQTQHFAGTPRYAAPEQLFGQRSPATDWYAFGTMLFEALTGEAPYRGTAAELLIKKREEDAPPLAERDDLPADLAALTDHLLRRAPEERPSSDAIAEKLAVDLRTVSHGSKGSHDAEPISAQAFAENSSQILIGREEQLAQLEEAKRELLEKRQPSVVWISGLSGEGKSSLAEQFLTPLRQRSDVLVLSGRCYDRESVPFKAIDCLIDAFVAFLRSRPMDEVRRLLPDDVHMLAQLFPVLRRVEAIADRAVLNITGIDSRQIRYRAFSALRELLATISQSTAVILFIDDLQWGDGDSAGALFELLLPPNPPAVMLLGTYRSDEADESPFVTDWRARNPKTKQQLNELTVEVSSLTEEQCVSMFAARLGANRSDVHEQAKRLFDAAQGNPYFLDQLIDGFDSAVESIRETSLPQLIDGRLSRLPADAFELLKAIAVSGQPLTIDEASQVSSHAGSALATLTHMRSEKLVRLIGADDRQLVDTYHDKIRETVLQRLDQAERRSLHLKFGEYIEQESLTSVQGESPTVNDDAGSPRVYDLAYHFSEAEDPRAFQYQLKAGKAALNEYAMEAARDYLNKAEQIRPPDLDRTLQFQLLFSLAEAMRGTSGFDESRELYATAMDLAETELGLAQCQYGIAAAWARQGEYVVAKQHFNNALAALGEPVPQTKAGLFVGTLSHLLTFHLIPAWLVKFVRRKKHRRDSEVLISSSLNQTAYITTDMLSLLHGFTRQIVSGKSSDDDGVKAMAYAAYGGILANTGLGWLGRRYARKGQQLAHRIDSELSKAMAAHDIGACLYLAGDLDQAELHLKASLVELERARHFLLAMSCHWLRHVQSARGKSCSIVHWAAQELQYGEQTNDNNTIAFGHYGLADGLGRCGEVEKAVEHARQASALLEQSEMFTVAIAYQELGRAQLQASDYESATKTLKRNVRNLWKELLFIEVVADTFSLLTEAILGADWFGGPNAIEKQTRRAALRSARWARFFCLKFPTLRAHCYRIRARSAVANGRTRNAIKYFDKAITSATKIGAQYEHARALIDKSMLDYPEAVADREQGFALLESLGCVLPDAELEYLGIDRDAHHARAAAAREAVEAAQEIG